MAGRALQITYLGDAKSVLAAQKQIDAGHTTLQGGVAKTGSAFKNTFGSVIPGASFLAVAGIGLAAKAIVDAATTETEAQNQVNVIFGKSVQAVNAFAENSATSAGISKGAALEAAGGFGAMLKSAGLAADESANLSVKVVQLAGDLASFKNVAPEEALEKLRSGLAGEAEPLRQFGVFLSEAAVQSEAYSSGIAKTGEELTEAQKVQARYNIILDQTTDAQGDFGRTLGESLPNQLRALKASLTDLAADVGKLVLPVLTQLVKVVGAAAQHLDVLLAVGVAYVAWKYLPGLLLQVAAGMDAIGISAGTNALVGLSGVARALGAVAVPIAAAIAAGTILNETFYGTDQSASDAAATIQGELNAALQSGQISVKEYRTAIAEANEQGGGFVEVQDEAKSVLAEVAESLGITEDAASELSAAELEAASAAEEHTDALRELQQQMLAAEGSFLAVHTAAGDLAEAQREVNRLQRQGKEDTKAYDDAVLEALESQLSFEGALLSYAEKADAAGASTKDIAREIREAGREAGLTKDDVNALVREVIALIDKGKEYDGSTFTANFRAIQDLPPGVGPRLQHGGIVTRPTVALIGEAGPEAVIPLSRGGGMAGMTVNVYVAGSVVSEDELVDVVLTGIRKAGIRNVTAGIP